MSSSSMYARILKTLAALLLGTGQEIVFQLLSVLLWIKFWGVEVYSEWVLLSLVPMLATRGSVGLFHAAASEMISLVASGRHDHAAGVLKVLRVSQWWWLGCVAAVLALVSSLVFASNPDPKIPFADIVIITTMFTFQFALFQWQQAELNILKAEGLATKAVLWQTVFRTVFVATMLIACIWFGPVGSLSLAVAIQASVLLVTRIRLTGLRRNYHTDTPLTRGSEVRRLVTQGLHFSAFPLGQTALHSCAVWALGLTAGPVAGAAFHNMRTISRLLVLVARALEQALRFELSAAVVRDGIEIARALVRRIATWTLAVGLVATAGMLVAGPLVFETITRSELPFDFPAFAVLCGAALFYALAQPFKAVLFSLNRHGGLANQYLIVLLSAVAATVLLSVAGPLPVALAMLGADAALLLLARRAVHGMAMQVPGKASHVV